MTSPCKCSGNEGWGRGRRARGIGLRRGVAHTGSWGYMFGEKRWRLFVLACRLGQV